jgi:hypothetical protein
VGDGAGDPDGAGDTDGVGDADGVGGRGRSREQRLGGLLASGYGAGPDRFPFGLDSLSTRRHDHRLATNAHQRSGA